MPHPKIPHTGEDMEQAVEVVVKVPQRLLHRLPHCLERRKMDDSSYVGMLFKNEAGSGQIAEVGGIVEYPPAGDGLHAVQHRGICVAKVINADDLEAVFDEVHDGMAADVTATSGDEDFGHGCFVLLRGQSWRENQSPAPYIQKKWPLF